jgi:hypothetical protein
MKCPVSLVSEVSDISLSPTETFLAAISTLLNMESHWRANGRKRFFTDFTDCTDQLASSQAGDRLRF